jgi:flagellum-specific ATP synthase
MAELIRLGAYRMGSDPKVDEAVKLYPAIETFLTQGKFERSSLDTVYAELAKTVNEPWNE